MHVLKDRRFKVVIICLLSAILELSSLSPNALAQEPSPFEISVIPLGDHAVSGQPFTYTVTITNVSQQTLGNVFVNVDVPEGTKFVKTHHLSEKWYGGVSNSDPNAIIEQVKLFALEGIQPGEVFSFEMMVDVFPETKKQIAVDAFNSTTLKGDVLAVGTPVSIVVQTPTPTPSPTPLPSPTSSPTQIPTAALVVANDPLPPPIQTLEPPTEQTLTHETETNASLFIIAAGGAFLVILVFIGIFWILKKR